MYPPKSVKIHIKTTNKKLYKPKSDEDLLKNDFSENNTQNISDEILKLDGLLKSGVITKEEFEQAKKKLLKEKLFSFYFYVEKPLIKILAFMEMEGVEVDNKFLKTLSSKFEKKIKNLEKEIFKMKFLRLIKQTNKDCELFEKLDNDLLNDEYSFVID